MIQIKALWDEESGVWVATSDDVPGLVTEAETSEELIRKLRGLIPELLEVNGLRKYNEIPFHLISERTDMIKVGLNE